MVIPNAPELAAPSARLPRLDPELVVVIVTGAGSNQKGTPRAAGCAATTGPSGG